MALYFIKINKNEIGVYGNDRKAAIKTALSIVLNSDAWIFELYNLAISWSELEAMVISRGVNIRSREHARNYNTL